MFGQSLFYLSHLKLYNKNDGCYIVPKFSMIFSLTILILLVLAITKENLYWHKKQSNSRIFSKWWTCLNFPSSPRFYLSLSLCLFYFFFPVEYKSRLHSWVFSLFWNNHLLSVPVELYYCHLCGLNVHSIWDFQIYVTPAVYFLRKEAFKLSLIPFHHQAKSPHSKF